MLAGVIIYSRLERARLSQCKKCGYKNPKDTKYCIKCGVHLKASRERYFIGDESYFHVLTPEWLLLIGAIITLYGVEWYRQKAYIIQNPSTLWIYVILPLVIGSLFIISFFYVKLKK